jgi:phage baseplate assembly protein W
VAADIIGTGWSFPVRPGAAGRLVYQGGGEKIRQAIWILLSTAPGERVMLPEFGCGIHELVFEANTASLRALVQARVRESLTRWEPRIDVLEVVVETAPDARHYLLIRIDYRVRRSNAFFNLVYPFFLREGPG